MERLITLQFRLSIHSFQAETWPENRATRLTKRFDERERDFLLRQDMHRQSGNRYRVLSEIT